MTRTRTKGAWDHMHFSPRLNTHTHARTRKHSYTRHTRTRAHANTRTCNTHTRAGPCARPQVSSAPPAYVTSSSAGAWGLEGLTLYVTAYANAVVRFTPGTEGAFMRRCRIRFNSYFCLEPKRGAGSRGRNSDWEHDVGVAVLLAGRNLFVTDNDIYSSGDVVSTRGNGAAGAEYMCAESTNAHNAHALAHVLRC